jgi:hypothetical protein
VESLEAKNLSAVVWSRYHFSLSLRRIKSFVSLSIASLDDLVMFCFVMEWCL